MRLRPVAVGLGIGEAMARPDLFGPFFAGSSWATWRAVLKASDAERLSDLERAAFDKVAGGRKPPSRAVSQIVAVAGRGAGKDSVASAIVCHMAASFDPRGKLRPGEQAVAMLMAVDKEQAGICFRYIKALFEEIPALKALVINFGSDSIALSNDVVIEVHPLSFRSVRGRSILCAVLDEVAFWRDENSAVPDVEVATALQPGLARVPGSALIMISSAHRRSGLLYQRWRDFYGKDDEDVLVVYGGTLDFNPTFSSATIDKDIERDPQLFGAEYLSQWRDDISGFISRELLDSAVDSGVKVRPPQPGVQYRIFADPSGGRGDSFSWSVAHADGEAVVLDCLVERRPPFNPSGVVAEVAATAKEYRCLKVIGDHYAAEWVVEAFEKHSLKYEHSKRDRSELYQDCLPLFTSGRARLLDNQRLISQLAQLERRTFPTGRDRIDHPRAGHDDCSNAAAGALVLATKPAFFSLSAAAVARTEVPVAASQRLPSATSARGPYGITEKALGRLLTSQNKVFFPDRRDNS